MYARSRFAEINEGSRLFSPQDQRHELNFVNMFKWNRYTFALTWIYGTGKPVTEFEIESTVIRKAFGNIADFQDHQAGGQSEPPT